MLKTTLGAVALTIALGLTSAQAATLINRAAAAHRIIVVEGDQRQEFTVQSAQEIPSFCQASCSVYVGEDPDPYDVASNDKLEILGGELHYQVEPENSADKQ